MEAIASRDPGSLRESSVAISFRRAWHPAIRIRTVFSYGRGALPWVTTPLAYHRASRRRRNVRAQGGRGEATVRAETDWTCRGARGRGQLRREYWYRFID